MQVNHNDISTGADNAPIFVIAEAGSRFTNLGRLTTSGDLSSAISVAVDGVTVDNHGTLTTRGDGSAGVAVGALFGPTYNGVTVINHGAITATGDVYDDGTNFAVAGGIELGAGSSLTAINYGSISAVEGIGLAGSNSLVVNYGTIEALGSGVYIQGVDAPSTNNTAINRGTIHLGASAEFQQGIAFFTDHGVVKNYGLIQVDGFHDFGIDLEGVGSQGENWGKILATADQGRGVLLNFYENSFVNRGLIQTTGDASVGVRWAAGEVEFGSNGGTFTNFGAVKSAGWSVRGNEQVNTVVNRGLLAGDVDLGQANDTFVAGQGGQLDGALTLGGGDDLIIFERGGGRLTVTDFVAGPEADRIDLTAFSFRDFGSLASHASQVGADVVLNLGGHDQIVLQHVALGSLSAADFVFAG